MLIFDSQIFGIRLSPRVSYRICLLTFPAVTHGWTAVTLVAILFGVVTIGTMTTIVVLGARGLKLVTPNWIERYVHALAGGTIAVSGIAIKAFGL